MVSTNGSMDSGLVDQLINFLIKTESKGCTTDIRDPPFVRHVLGSGAP